MFQHPNPSSPTASRTTGPTTAGRSSCLTHTYPSPQQVGQSIVYLNWSHFKPEFSGKPVEDAECHLLCTNDWMSAHHFVEGVKVQRLCLTLLGEARLWYHSLEPINIDWQGLQNLFRQQ